jgi:hypothetical protein
MDRKLVQILIAVAALLLAAAPLCARPWGIVTTSADYYADNESDNESLHTIDLGQTPPTVYGPFLSGELTARRGLGAFDIAMLPGNKKALVAAITPLMRRPPIGSEASPSQMPSTSQISLVNLKDPTNPFVENSIELMGEATDIAVTKNGKLAIVCLTGGYANGNGAIAKPEAPSVAFINVKDFSYEYIYLGSRPAAVPAANGFSKYAQSVAISRKNIAIFTDFDNGAVHYGKINKTLTGFESLRTLYLCEVAYDNNTFCNNYPAPPVNVAISPDGRTALVAPGFGGALFVFEITNKGDLVPGKPFILTGLPGGPLFDTEQGGQLSIAFRDNKTAYVVSYRYPDGYEPLATEPGAIPGSRPDKLCEISILGPGRTQYVASRFDMLNSNFVFPIFGFESLDILKRHALVGNNALQPFENDDNQTSDNPYDNPNYNFVNYIDFATGTMTPVELNNYGVGTGVAIKP